MSRTPNMSRLGSASADPRELMAQRLAQILAEMDQAASTRLPPPVEGAGETVEILAVSKYRSVEEIVQARELGLRHFGENRPQEIRDKLQDPRTQGLSFDCIGQLQRNKVKYVIGRCRLIQSLDRLSLAQELSLQACRRDLVQGVLLELNYAEEASKTGYVPEALERDWEQLLALPGLELRGLMALAPAQFDSESCQQYFLNLRKYFEELRSRLDRCARAQKFNCLSLGMSRDYVPAIRAGSTSVRLGQALFGPRPGTF